MIPMKVRILTSTGHPQLVPTEKSAVRALRKARSKAWNKSRPQRYHGRNYILRPLGRSGTVRFDMQKVRGLFVHYTSFSVKYPSSTRRRTWPLCRTSVGMDDGSIVRDEKTLGEVKANEGA